MIKLFLGDSREILKKFPTNSIDSIVTDPPYGLNFMNHKWDHSGIENDVLFWEENLRILKPGGHLLAFSSTRTYHRMATAIEDAGFEIRDTLTWLTGQGFPKSLNIGKQIDKILGNERVAVGVEKSGKNRKIYNASKYPESFGGDYEITKGNSEYEGWGTSLKPSCELIVMARKPISEKNIALNVLKWGVGGINIDACRIELNGEIIPINVLEKWTGFGQLDRPEYTATENTKGRWPSNVLLDEIAVDLVEEQKEGVARFFYCAKASPKERGDSNGHPTVKPISLMEYLVKLITPKGGIVLDPFMGSGTTGIACKNLNFNFIGVELNKEYYDIASKRIEDNVSIG